MKKKFLWLLALVLICTSCLFACSPVNLSGGPDAKDTVYGNGGVAVVKGNYLYFANAYKDYNDIEKNENNYGKDDTKSYAIYRTKLNDGVVEQNSKGEPKGAELLAPIVGGHIKSGLYIGGDYLFYATPHTVNLEGQSSATKGYLRFEKVSLDGKEHEILSENEFNINCDYNVNHINGTTYITIRGPKGETPSADASTASEKDIYVIKCKGGNHSQYKITSSATSFATYLQEDIYYGRSIDEVNNYVYYTKKDSNNEYSLYRKPLADGTEEKLIVNSNTELSLVCVKNNRVYYKDNNILYSSTTFNSNDKVVYTVTDIKDDATSGIVDYVILKDTIGSGSVDNGIMVVRKDDSIYEVVHYKPNGYMSKKTSFTELYTGEKQINILFETNGQIFYTIAGEDDTSSTSLYSYNYAVADGSNNHYEVIVNFTTSVEDKVTTFDYDNDRVYFFGKVDNSKGQLNYLQMALLEGNKYKNEDRKSIAIYIGVLDANDVKPEENED